MFLRSRELSESWSLSCLQSKELIESWPVSCLRSRELSESWSMFFKEQGALRVLVHVF